MNDTSLFSKMSSFLQSFVEFNVKSIVDKPESVVVKVSISTKNIIVQIEVEQTEIGKIIGKSGKNRDALAILCYAAKNTNFSNDSRKIILEIIEDENTNFSYKK